MTYPTAPASGGGPATLALSLVSHTNIGKTTLARTLLGSDVGEVRDAPHVTEFAQAHELIRSPHGDRLQLWDTPGFGDSTRLARRMRGRSQPLGWVLSELWDRWRDRPFWASQQALRHVQAHSHVVLYLVNAAETPAAAGYVQAEMELLAWLDKPVLVLLNQLGAPREATLEAADVAAWQQHLARWPLVRAVLPMDAFARCWVHELTLLKAVQDVLAAPWQPAMGRLAAAWQARHQATLEQALDELALSLARQSRLREPLAPAAGADASHAALPQDAPARLAREAWRQVTQALKGQATRTDPAAQAEARAREALMARLQDEAAASTDRLIALHGLAGRSGQTRELILQRVGQLYEAHRPVPEGKAALWGGAVTGALTGLKADLASGGLTLGGGMLAGALLGALGGAGLARGVNAWRGGGPPALELSDDALAPLAQAAVLRYLAVAHFGRGRGEWQHAEAPLHWVGAVEEAMALHQPAWTAAWRVRAALGEGPAHRADRPPPAAPGAPPGGDAVDAAAALARALRAPLTATLATVLQRLYPDAPRLSPDGR